ncbi:MAG: mandelate racemase/muconate lactonizing enzyme family protein [Limisphaerales bacterium]
MKIDAVDFFYLSIPNVRDIGDGSQDALLVRVRSRNDVGWGECEASPLVCIASWSCPMSHSACKPLRDSVLGQRLETPSDITRIHATAKANSFDLLQTDHTLSGIDIALWDLMGRRHQEPVHCLLGQREAHPKVAYASQLFGDDPQATCQAARAVVDAGFRAAKFGWGPFGRGSLRSDEEHVRAAREGLGSEIALMVDAGTVWGENVEAAAARLPVLEEVGAIWLEEPFHGGALNAYRELARRCSGMKLQLAAGEGCHDGYQARTLIDHAGLGFVQIDTGRVGGISIAAEVARHAELAGMQFVNHTFTTSLALSASLQPYAGLSRHRYCEYPFAPSSLALELTRTRLLPDPQGLLRPPEAPGLGLEPDPAALRRYAVDYRIEVGGKTLASSPTPEGKGVSSC